VRICPSRRQDSVWGWAFLAIQEFHTERQLNLLYASTFPMTQLLPRSAQIVLGCGTTAAVHPLGGQTLAYASLALSLSSICWPVEIRLVFVSHCDMAPMALTPITGASLKSFALDEKVSQSNFGSLCFPHGVLFRSLN
jgi:hypothetical protein